MVGMVEISAGFSSLVAIKNIVQGLNSANIQARINDIKIELQGHVIDAQGAIMAAQANETALLQRISHLEQQIAESEDWEAEKQRYELKAIDTGATAYVHKPGMDNGESPVWLCQQCFESRHKSTLQLKDPNAGHGGSRTHHRYGCNRCKGDVIVRYTRNPSKASDEPS